MILKAMRIVTLMAVALVACDNTPDLDTRTFQLSYLQMQQLREIIGPYLGDGGTMSVSEGIVTVRARAETLEEIEEVLARYDRPTMITLHFQIIEADGASDRDPAIAEVEQELRRLFRFEGYSLVAEAQVAGVQGTGIRQVLRGPEARQAFSVHTGVSEVRALAENPTVTLDIILAAMEVGDILETTVTVPIGHSVVIGTVQPHTMEGALILVVRAEITGAREAPDVAPAGAERSATAPSTGDTAIRE